MATPRDPWARTVHLVFERFDIEALPEYLCGPYTRILARGFHRPRQWRYESVAEACRLGKTTPDIVARLVELDMVRVAPDGGLIVWWNKRRLAGARWQALRTAVFERDDYRCRWCGSTEDLECDHVHPFSRGGGDDLENLQTLCGPCNRRKHAKSPERLRHEAERRR